MIKAIEEYKPKRILMLSYRQTLTLDLKKNFEHLGFEDYLTGNIEADRVDVEQPGLFMLGSVKEQLLIFVDSHTLATGEKSDLEAACSKDCDAQQGVGGALHYCYLSEDRSEVGIVGTVESCPVTEDDVKRPVPSLRIKLNLATVSGFVTETFAPLSITPGSSIVAHIPGAIVAVNSVGGPSSLWDSRRAAMRVFSLSDTKALWLIMALWCPPPRPKRAPRPRRRGFQSL